jgi:hypothetical protein
MEELQARLEEQRAAVTPDDVSLSLVSRSRQAIADSRALLKKLEGERSRPSLLVDGPQGLTFQHLDRRYAVSPESTRGDVRLSGSGDGETAAEG